MATQLALFGENPEGRYPDFGVSLRRRPQVELWRRELFAALQEVCQLELAAGNAEAAGADLGLLTRRLDETYLEAGRLVGELERKGYGVFHLRMDPEGMAAQASEGPSFAVRPLKSMRRPRAKRRGR